jgi:hypothetical protein
LRVSRTAAVAGKQYLGLGGERFADLINDRCNSAREHRIVNRRLDCITGTHQVIQQWPSPLSSFHHQVRVARRGDHAPIMPPCPPTSGSSSVEILPYVDAPSKSCLAALLLKFYDFAIEIATEGDFSGEEADKLIAMARRQAQHSPDDAVADLEALLARMKADPAEANLEFCRFIDQHRSSFNVADAALPRSQPVPLAHRRPVGSS